MLEHRLELPVDFLTPQKFPARLHEQSKQFESRMIHLTLPLPSQKQDGSQIPMHEPVRYRPHRATRCRVTTRSVTARIRAGVQCGIRVAAPMARCKRSQRHARTDQES